MKELLSGLIGPVTGIINKVVPDKDEAARLAHEISTMADRHAQALAVAQIEVNRAEAAGNWFQASWRPLCGYVCVLGLAVNFLISPIAAGFGFVVPQADMSTKYSASKLYEAYRHYCQAIGRKPQSTNAFKKALEKLPNVYQHRTSSGMQWQGIQPVIHL
jgi:hypothetical protein